MAEIDHALAAGVISLHTKIKGRVADVNNEGRRYNRIVETTPGRMKIGELLPKSIGISYDLCNKLMTKRDISKMIDAVYRHCGQKESVIFCDRIMSLGFYNAYKAGISFGKDDMVIPETKEKIVGDHARPREGVRAAVHRRPHHPGREVQQGRRRLGQDHRPGGRGNDGAHSGRPDRRETGREKQINSIYMMSHSGARGSPAQMKQLGGMRGLMAKPSGEIIETPIISNFKEGLSVLEYFNSTHGARKGLADTALKTANSGYLTRRLVDVAQDAIISEVDCGTKAASPRARSSTRARSSPRWAAAFSAAHRQTT
jgi:DNA-directed RNA polymerase subunit beta'